MSAEMLVALGGILTGIAGIISALMLNRKTMLRLEYRMEQVEKRLDSHNSYSEKFAKNSEQMGDIKQDIAVIKTTLEFLRKENA